MDSNTETVEQDQIDTNQKNVVELINEIDEIAKSVMSGQRELNKLYKELEKAHKRELKLARKNRSTRSRNPGEKKDPSGFNKPQAVPIEFYDQPWGCTADQELPRTVLTKMVYDYIKEHELQASEDKRVINPDSTLKSLFHLNDGDKLEFKNFQTYMARLYNRNFEPDDTSNLNIVSTSESESETEKVVKKTKSKGKAKKTSSGEKKSKSANSSI